MRKKWSYGFVNGTFVVKRINIRHKEKDIECDIGKMTGRNNGASERREKAKEE
jgi:hypothetical protein